MLCGIGYGWDPNAVRVGVAALVRAGAVKIVVGQKEYSNPSDRDLIDALRVAHKFNKAELILEETEVDPRSPHRNPQIRDEAGEETKSRRNPGRDQRSGRKRWRPRSWARRPRSGSGRAAPTCRCHRFSPRAPTHGSKSST